MVGPQGIPTKAMEEVSAACGAATSALRQQNRLVGSLQLQLGALLQRRAAERAAHAADCAAGSPLEADPDCCVCYEPLDRPHAVVTACGHVYHRACIENAIELGRGKCPICRRTVHTAELVQIMNGLPSQRHADDVEEAVEVVSLDSPTPGKNSREKRSRCEDQHDDDSDDCTPLLELRAKKRRRPRPPDPISLPAKSTEEVGRAIDDLIRDLLKNLTANRARAQDVIELERALQSAVETLEQTCAHVVADGEAERKQIRKEASAHRVEHKAAIAKLQAAHQDVADTRAKLNEQAAESRKLQDQLLINIKNAEAAAEEAKREKEAARELCLQTEKKRERFQTIAQTYEHKRRQLKLETEKMESLTMENTKLKNMNEALRIQVRRIQNLPQRKSSDNDARTALRSFDILDDLELDNSDEAEATQAERRPRDTTALVDLDNEESDDDIVAAAERRFNRRKRSSDTCRDQPEPETPCQHNGSHTPCPEQQPRIDLELFGPVHALEPPARIRPPPPRAMQRRRCTGRPSVGVAAFRPEPPPPVAKIGAIAAPRPATNHSTRQSLGAKGTTASLKPTEVVSKSSAPKLRTSKISSFFK